MADFDIIVVGGSCAGSVAAYEAAKADASVLLVERGVRAGSKNMTGGRIYTHSLKKVFPDFEQEAPLERRVMHEKISMLTSESALTVDYSTKRMAEEQFASYTVLRGPFDEWLTTKAAEADVECIFGIAVEDLLTDASGRITGITAGGDEITSEVVILADGANSLLTRKAVGAPTPKASQMAVGIKQIIELSPELVANRMNTCGEEGAAWLFVGDVTKGRIGGGFLYSNKSSISIGLVATIADLQADSLPIYQLLEEFKAHPVVAPVLQGGKVIEHSGHMVPEGGYDMMPNLVGDGVIIAGESAMMCVNLGYMVRGMDYAIAAGMHAGRSAAVALANGNCSKEGLRLYTDALNESFVLQDLKQFSKFPHYMEKTTRLFNEYPVLVENIMNTLFLVDGSPMKPLQESVRPHLKEVGYMNLFRDAKGAMKSL